LTLIVGTGIIIRREILFPKNNYNVRSDSDTFNDFNPLDGCLHVYLDVGTNVGIQIRKIFEPSLFPGAPALPIFDKYFGSPDTRKPQDVCVVGFEPNPAHIKKLEKLEEAYNKCGWRVLINKKTGVAGRNSEAHYQVEFSFDFEIKLDVAGRLVDNDTNTNNTVKVKSIWLAEFVNNIVAKRKRPDGKRGSVVMKLDIEGKELEVVPDLVMSGALPHIDSIHLDWTNDPYTDLNKVLGLKGAMELLNGLANENNLQHVTEILAVDDETYFEFDGKLPIC